MDYINSIWQIGLIALVAGALIGALAHRLLAPSAKEADRARTERDAARDELKQYKTSVNQHFDKTAELVNDLTQNYVKVYQHLAEGAQTLGDSKTLNNLLEQQPGKVAIAVDEQAEDAVASGDDPVADSPSTPATPERPPDTPAEPVDEHAEPYVVAAASGVATAAPASEATPDETGDAVAASESAESAADSEAAKEGAKPVVNVEVLEQAIEEADSSEPAETGPATAENKDKTGVSATTH